MLRIRYKRATLAIGFIIIGLFYMQPIQAQPYLRNKIPTDQKQRPILFILDASGSMAELFDNVPRMVAARVMLFEKLKRLDPERPVGLVAYGNRIAGCRSTRIYAPIRKLNRKSLISQIKRMHPAGATPLANTLRLVRNTILPLYPGTTIVIISDGAESCGGNPVREAQRIKAMGADIKVNIIGLAVDKATANQLQQVARATNGQYFDVHNHTDFANAIDASSKPIVELNKPRPSTSIRPQPVPQVNSDAMLKITKVYQMQNAEGKMEWRIKYEFSATRPGDYFVNIKVLHNPAPGGRGGRIQNDDRLHASRGNVHFRLKGGTGEIKIPVELLPTNSNRRAIYVQGELWDTSSVPLHLYISNPVPLQ